MLLKHKDKGKYMASGLGEKGKEKGKGKKMQDENRLGGEGEEKDIQGEQGRMRREKRGRRARIIKRSSKVQHGMECKGKKNKRHE